MQAIVSRAGHDGRSRFAGGGRRRSVGGSHQLEQRKIVDTGCATPAFHSETLTVMRERVWREGRQWYALELKQES